MFAALAVAGCGGGPSGAKDLTMAADLASGAGDLATREDLAEVEGDLGTTPDLAVEKDMRAPSDLAIDSDGGPGKCMPSAGYGGMDRNGRMVCGYAGMCGGKSFTLDCDGVSCTCAVDKVLVQKFLQLQTCADKMAMDSAWANGCGF